MNRPIIAIPIGDAAGIGPEIVVRAYAQGLLGVCQPLVVGTVEVMEQIAQALNLEVSLEGWSDPEEMLLDMSHLHVFDLENLFAEEVEWGQPTAKTSRAAVSYMEVALGLCLEGYAAGMTTAPIGKDELRRAGFLFDGHTELLAERAEATDYATLFVADDLRVALVTTHIPFREVLSSLTREEIMRVLRLLQRWYPLVGLGTPRIAVAALNPHGGGEGALGDEEVGLLRLAIEEARAEGIDACGPVPADLLFIPSLRHKEKIDVILALYHDQAMIPLRAVSFGKAVNVTLGLPVVRTAVDHGPAYDLAGRGEAQIDSLVNAVSLAAQMAARRAASSIP